MVTTLPETMYAAVCDRYGVEAVTGRQVPVPTPGRGEVLLRVRAAGVNPGDWFMLNGSPAFMRLGTGLRRPRRSGLGRDVAGTVVALGPGVDGLAAGAEVFGVARDGFAQYAVARADRLAAAAPGASPEQWAAAPTAGLAALHALRDVARVRPGDSVLVVGASGGVGTFAVQLAAAMGAQVTGVCGPRTTDLVASLGASRVIDYSREDVLAAGGGYDVILDNVADHTLTQLQRILAPHGTLIPNSGSGGRVLGPLPRLARAGLVDLMTRQRVKPFVSSERSDDLAALAAYLVAGQVRPVVGATFPLDRAGEALSLVGTGHARGKVVLIP